MSLSPLEYLRHMLDETESREASVVDEFYRRVRLGGHDIKHKTLDELRAESAAQASEQSDE